MFGRTSTSQPVSGEHKLEHKSERCSDVIACVLVVEGQVFLLYSQTNVYPIDGIRYQDLETIFQITTGGRVS
jgi:hypothetical protein